jgi:hypothetical protein
LDFGTYKSQFTYLISDPIDPTITNDTSAPQIRSLGDNIMILGIIPGPSEPKDLDSFLHPFIKEVLSTKSNPQPIPRSKEVWSAVIVLVSADTRAFKKLLKLKGVNSYYACRFCLQKGCLAPNKHVYYPNGKKDWPKRTYLDFVQKALQVEQVGESIKRSELTSMETEIFERKQAEDLFSNIYRCYCAEPLYSRLDDLESATPIKSASKSNGIHQGEL